MINSIKAIFWDFDGVLMNSNEVRDRGFEHVLCNYPKEQVDKLMHFHRENGGLSRYVKFRYFFEVIRGESVTNSDIQFWANQFSAIMLDHLIDESLLIKETIDFIKTNFRSYDMHIVSGSDGNELRKICDGVGLARYFLSIEGSPTPKVELVKRKLSACDYNPNECFLIGDSINDFHAAKQNGMYFKAYNNSTLENKTDIDFTL